jgi:SAM-dependent methyltransferase
MTIQMIPSARQQLCDLEFSVVVHTEGAEPPAHLETLLHAAQAMQPQKRSFELLGVGPEGSQVSAVASEVPLPYSYCVSREQALAQARGRWIVELRDGVTLTYPDLSFGVPVDFGVCPPFTAHNIGFGENQWTRPGQTPFEEEERAQAILRVIDRVAASRPGRPLRVADLGALEMGFAVEAARRGHDTLALEGRKSNIERFGWLQPRLELPNLTVVCDDVRNIAQHGSFDVVLCLGLLYHLDNPREVLQAIAAVTSDTLVLDTHVAIENDPDWPQPLVVNEGVPGRWYPEFAEGATLDQVALLSWASLDNPKSFWIEAEALRILLREAGFPLIFQIEDVDSRLNRHVLVAMRDRS